MQLILIRFMKYNGFVPVAIVACNKTPKHLHQSVTYFIGKCTLIKLMFQFEAHKLIFKCFTCPIHSRNITLYINLLLALLKARVKARLLLLSMKSAQGFFSGEIVY